MRWALCGVTLLAVATGAQSAPLRMGAPAQIIEQDRTSVEAACTERQPPFAMPVEDAGSATRPRRDAGTTTVHGPEAGRGSLAPGTQGRLRLNGQKYASPVGARTEAGLGLSFGSHVSIQLNYARTASVPMMGYANDNGILARVRIGF